MHYLAATLHTAGVRMIDRVQDTPRRWFGEPDRGASAVEWAMIVAAAVAIVGLVIVAVRTFVTTEIGKIG